MPQRVHRSTSGGGVFQGFPGSLLLVKSIGQLCVGFVFEIWRTKLCAAIVVIVPGC